MNLIEKNIFWDRLLKAIEERVNIQSFTTWFKPLTLKELSEDTLVISVPQPYFSSWLEEHYLPLISSLSRSILGYDVQIHFSFTDSSNKNEE